MGLEYGEGVPLPTGGEVWTGAVQNMYVGAFSAPLSAKLLLRCKMLLSLLMNIQ